MSDDIVTARVRLLLDQLGQERDHAYGWKSEVARALDLHPSTVSKIVGDGRGAGRNVMQQAIERLRIRPEFFTDSSIEHPHYRDFVESGSRVDRDEDTLRAVRDMISDILSPDERREYEEHDADWGREMAFKDLRSILGIDNVTPELIYNLWRSRRSDRRGKSVSRGMVLEPKVRPGRVRLKE